MSVFGDFMIGQASKQDAKIEQLQTEIAAAHRALVLAEDVLTEFGSHSDDTRTGAALMAIARILYPNSGQSGAGKGGE